MAEIAYPNNYSETGTWLLSQEALTKFDVILDNFTKRFEEQREIDVKEECEKRLQQLYTTWAYKQASPDKQAEMQSDALEKVASSFTFSRDKVEIAISLQSKKIVKVKRFAEAQHLHEVQEDAPRGFSLDWRCGRFEVSVELQETLLRDGYRATVSPLMSGVSIECLTAIRNWSEEYRLRGWAGFCRGLQVWVISFACFLFFFLWALAGSSTTSPKRQELLDEARKMAKDGIKPEQERRAIEVMLALQSGYEPEPSPSYFVRLPWWFWVGFGLLFFTTAILCFPPTTAIAIGAGVDQVSWRRWWVEKTTFTVPGLFVSSVILPLLKSFVEKSF